MVGIEPMRFGSAPQVCEGHGHFAKVSVVSGRRSLSAGWVWFLSFVMPQAGRCSWGQG